ncbi:SPASM domain-containing protein [Planomonospora sp. ID82291]|uniref:SPASM domain-containing protein n=1 Tax=Planomonospora sp. ID82291 TaxID=2738136 RepID=UPI0018C3B2C2|nr:SPASM domain-containing protein [Planomonospora sp. ID82291]MBG0818357.1 SPASM domain-containing protein [Planomonospora sp. ID82291]
MIGVLEHQRAQQGITVLERLGVPEIGYDDLREVGRGVRDNGPGIDQLCGHCGDQQIAISPTGEVWPCVFSRWLPAGNVHQKPLADILTSQRFTQITGQLREEFGARAARPCRPDPCSPSCRPANNCRPANSCAPNYACGLCAPRDKNCNPGMSCNLDKCRPTR